MDSWKLRSKQTLFSKWLPRPNHYAHKICIGILSRTTKWLPRPNHYAHKMCIGILSRTMVSILKYLSPGPQHLRKACTPVIIVPWPECRPEFPSDGDAGGVPTTLDIWRSPGPTCPGTKYPVPESITSTKAGRTSDMKFENLD